MNETKLHTGFLYKKGVLNKAWKKRYFVLYHGRKLAYFENTEDTVPKGDVDLSEVQSVCIVPLKSGKEFSPLLSLSPSSSGSQTSSPSSMTKAATFHGQQDENDKITLARQTLYSDRAYTFELVTAKRTYLFAAQSQEEMEEWIKQIETCTFGHTLYSGWLTKRGAYRKNWKKRYFVIYDTLEMRYYTNETKTQPLGLIKLRDVLLMCPGDKTQYGELYTIQLMTPDRNWVFGVDKENERKNWVLKFEEIIHGAKRLITLHEGPLYKKSLRIKGWKERYFALSKGWLFYFDEERLCEKFKSISFFNEVFFNQASRLYIKGSIPLRNITVCDKTLFKDEGYENVFEVSHSDRKYYFATKDEDSLQTWIDAFSRAMKGSMDSQYDEYKTDKVESFNNFIPENLSEEEYDGSDTNDPLDDDLSNVQSIDTDDKKEMSTVKKNASRRYMSNDDNVFDLIDPNHDGNWLDLEDESIVKKQSTTTRKSFQNQK